MHRGRCRKQKRALGFVDTRRGPTYRYSRKFPKGYVRVQSKYSSEHQTTSYALCHGRSGAEDIVAATATTTNAPAGITGLRKGNHRGR